MSLMQCRTRTALELSRTRRSADDRYYYETPAFDYAHAECSVVVVVVVVVLVVVVVVVVVVRVCAGHE